MEAILNYFNVGQIIKSRCDDDRIDRLNHQITVIMLILFSVVVTTKAFVGEPITCWISPMFNGNQEEYINNYCWVRSTYYLDYDREIPDESKPESEKHNVTYYQWIPLILLVEALFFYLPYAFWISLGYHSGLDVNSIVEAGESFTATEMTEVREKTLKYMTSQMDRYLGNGKVNRYKNCGLSFKSWLLRPFLSLGGNYLFVFYIGVKVCYLINLVCQFFILDYLLGSSFWYYGFAVIKAAIQGQDNLSGSNGIASGGSRWFPRTTMCDFKIRNLGNIQRHTAQCVLPANHFNEKIFLFLWFWFIGLFIITTASLLRWLLKMALKSRLKAYVLERLNPEENGHVKQFVDYLNRDGVFITRLLALNADTITANDFLTSIHENYINKNLIGNRKEEKNEEDNSGPCDCYSSIFCCCNHTSKVITLDDV